MAKLLRLKNRSGHVEVTISFEGLFSWAYKYRQMALDEEAPLTEGASTPKTPSTQTLRVGDADTLEKKTHTFTAHVSSTNGEEEKGRIVLTWHQVDGTERVQLGTPLVIKVTATDQISKYFGSAYFPPIK